MQAVGLSLIPLLWTQEDKPGPHMCPSKMGPSCSSEGDSEASTVPRGSFRAGPCAQGSCRPRHLGCVCRRPQAQRHSRLPCRNKALCSGSSQEAASISVYTGFPGAASLCPRQPWRDFFLGRLPQRNCGLLPKAVLEEAALPQPAGSLPKCIAGETSEEAPDPSAKLSGSSQRAVTVSSPLHGCTKGTEPRRAPTPQPKAESSACVETEGEGYGGTSACSPWPGGPFRPHGSKAAGCSQASLDQEDPVCLVKT